MTYYEIWVTEDGSEASLLPSDSQSYDLLTHDVDGNLMTQSLVFEAESWAEAKRIYNAHLESLGL